MAKDEADPRLVEAHGAHGRRPWTPPRVRTLGSVAELTRKVARNGVNDGGVGTRKKS